MINEEDKDFSEPTDNDFSSANEDYKYTISDCWYCRLNHDNSHWYFSCEFDCFLHEECIRQEIIQSKSEDNNKELKTLAKELFDRSISELKEKILKEESL